MDYQLSRLNANEFEKLSQDIMQEHLGVRLQISPEGRDGGRDIYTDAKDIIIQCKHYKKTHKSTLIKNIAKELAKVKLLKPNRYLVICSSELTHTDKQNVEKSLDGYIDNTDDIWGYNDIEGFLRSNPQIVEMHPKLWVGTTAVLKKTLDDVVYRGALNLTRARIADAIDNINVYADIPANRGAVEKGLKANGSVIITGAPGVGKTTLAEFVFVKYVDKGWSPIVLSKNIQEAFDMQDTEKKQIFFWDDCWGDTFLEDKLERNEDSRLVLFLSECAKHKKTQRLILVSRDYIYNQAKGEYERLRRDVKIENVVVNLNNYSRLEKARILYNHLCEKDIGYSRLQQLVADRFYNSIIDHSSYSPRVIDAMVANAADYPVKEYRSKFIKSLDNPLLVWADSFERKLTNSARILLFSLYLVTRNWGYTSAPLVSEVNECFSRINKNFGGKPGDFKRAFSECNEALIHRVTNDRVDFYNPSIKDFLRNKLFEDKGEWFELLSSSNLNARESFNLIRGSEELFWEYSCSLSREAAVSLFERLVKSEDKPYYLRNSLLDFSKILAKLSEGVEKNLLKKVIVEQVVSILDPKNPDDHLAILECLKCINDKKLPEYKFLRAIVESLYEEDFSSSIDDVYFFVIQIFNFNDVYGPFEELQESSFLSKCKSFVEWAVESDLDHLSGEEPHDVSSRLDELKSWVDDIEVITPVLMYECHDMINGFSDTFDYEPFIPMFKSSKKSNASTKKNTQYSGEDAQSDIDSLFNGLLDNKKES